MKPLPKDTCSSMYFDACQRDNTNYDKKAFYAGMLAIVDYFLAIENEKFQNEKRPRK